MQIIGDNYIDRPMSSKSNVEIPFYENVTDINNIPYEEETSQYMEKSIRNQRKKLVQDALNYGLRLKAIDQAVETDAQKRRAQSQMQSRTRTQLGVNKNLTNVYNPSES